MDSVTNLIIIPKFGILHFTDGENFPEKEFGEFLNKNDSSLYDDFLKTNLTRVFIGLNRIFSEICRFRMTGSLCLKKD